MTQRFSLLYKCFIIVLMLALSAGPVTGVQARRTLAPQGTLQDLIDAAPDNGTVNIPAGFYSETLVIDKNLTLIGCHCDTTTLQSPGPNQRVIRVTKGHNLNLQNLTVTGGHLDNDVGGGIYLENGSLTLNSVWISNNSADSGGGVYQGGSDGSVTITASHFEYNNAEDTDGGGLFAEGSATITSSVFTHNTAHRHGGGAYVYNGNAQLTGGEFTENHAANGNGGGIDLNNGLTIDGTHFTGNTSTDQGGGVSQWNADQTVTISNATFSANTSKNKGGGACVNSYLTLSATSFSNNLVDTGGANNAYGGGLYAGGGLAGNGLTFTGNSVKCTGCSTTNGGGMYITRPTAGASSVISSTFEGNLAWSGSGMSSDSQVQLTLTDSTFRNNGDQDKAGYGGGISVSHLTGDRLLFEGNRTLNAGGVVSAGEATLSRSLFIDNSTAAAGGGGAIQVASTFNGTNLLFASNTSSYGAALKIQNGPATLRHVTISQPTQSTGPAILIDSTASVELYNSILTNYNPAIKLDGTLTEDHNMFYNNSIDVSVGATGVIHSGGYSTGLIDPLFVNPAIGNYRLSEDSYAIGHGTDLGVTTDLDGYPRQGRWDIGAYQFHYSFYLPIARN